MTHYCRFPRKRLLLMTPRHLIDRLSIQLESMQEGFELLSRAGNTRELARQFFHLLRGNLTTVEGHIFFRGSNESAWQKLYGKGATGVEYLESVPLESAFAVHLLKDKEMRLIAIQPLMDKSYVAILLGRKLVRSGYSELDRIILHVLLQLFANAYQAMLHRQKEKSLAFSLNHRLLQLNSLVGTGIDLTKLRDQRELARVALERGAALTNASCGTVRVMVGRKLREKLVFPGGSPLPGARSRSHRIRSGFRFAGTSYTFELFNKESRSGTGPFDETDQLLLDALTRQVEATFENQHLHAQEVEKQKIERDIAVAADIQQRILPRSLPVIEGYDIAGTNIPTKFVGGDYYDCIPLQDGRYALVMADVAGKGVPAALLVSSFHAYLSAYLEGSISLLDLTKRLNAAIYKTSTEERYITAALGLFTPSTGDLECVNAGHTASYLVRHDGDIVELGNGGLALGMLDMDFPYQTDAVTLRPGDRLFMYTDGVSEAMDAKGRLYDTDGYLKNLIHRHRPEAAEGLIRDLVADIQKFADAAPQADDITAMYLIRR